ncbi:hypothetical protein ABZ511_27530 [Nocardia gamkensis]|uniref:hypothetical protein n=1 Tax=Nocardia gamkensis TaxID=352869 RepID=UPI0033D9C77D
MRSADVLNLWRLTDLEHDATYASDNVDLRSATVDPLDQGGAPLSQSLLSGADVLFANRRPGSINPTVNSHDTM